MTAEQIRGAYRAGTINNATLVWRDGLDRWLKLTAIADEMELQIVEEAHRLAARPPSIDEARAQIGSAVIVAQRKKASSAGIWVIAILGVLLVGAILMPGGARWEEIRETRKLENLAKEAVLRSLKAPKTADVTHLATEREKGSVFIQGYVDAENGFGAMIRSKWCVQFTRDGASSWKATYFELDGKKEGTLR
jgi:hypothetical protein